MKVSIVLIVAYLISFIAGGHGAAPMGIVITWFAFELSHNKWLPVAITGWVGIIALVAVAIFPPANQRKKSIIILSSSTVLYASWLYAACMTAMSENGPFLKNIIAEAIFAIPLQLAYALTTRSILKKLMGHS